MVRAAGHAKTKAAARRAGASKAPKKALAPGPTAARLAAALAQQKATREILQLIAATPHDIQPVIDAIARRAARLCDAPFARVLLVEGEQLHPRAEYSTRRGRAGARPQPVPLRRSSITGRAVLDRKTVHHTDIVPLLDREYPDARDNAMAIGFRAVLAVPLLRADGGYGAIMMYRRVPRRFTPDQVALVQTFARQAVIALENTRLFKALGERNAALTESLEQQTATSEVLRVIAGSPTDTQPVFDLLAQRAGRLCEAEVAVVSRFEGGTIALAAVEGVNPKGVAIVRRLYPMAIDTPAVTARVIRDGAVVRIDDVLTEAGYGLKDFAVAANYRAGLGVPIVRERQVIGAIFVGRATPGPFTDSQVELLKTFADQAVIAIENVRLFKALDERTQALTRSVAGLNALSEVSDAVSATLDVETVLSTVVSRATRLSGTTAGAIYEYDKAREEFHLHTTHNLPAEVAQALRAQPIRKGEGALGRMAVTFEPVEIVDIADDAHYQSRVRATLLALGHRSLLAVPLLREGQLLGGLVVNRTTAGAFAPETIELLQTFASQSALAIQNARLFREIEEKSRQLEAASRHKTEFLANMSHELRTPLNAIIGFSEVLSERLFGEINDKQQEYVADIHESGRHLLSLINDILDLSKIEAGRMELELTEFALPQAIDNALTLVRERAGRHGIALDRALDERLATVRADERKVKQVLLNLLSNALKFTPAGGRVAVRAAVRDGMAEIAVADTGVGIAPEDQAAVFEEFRQVGAAAKKREGTGLGLAISRRFIELHGGRIRLDSAPGRGSTFTFTLPLKRGS